MTIPVAAFDAIDDLMALADAVFETPARRHPMGAGSAISAVAVPPPGGPVTVPAVRARDDGRAVGKGGAATFTLPDTRVPLVFPPDGPFPGSPPAPPPDPGPPQGGDGPNKPNPMPPGTPPPGGPPGPPPPLRGDAGQLEPPVPQAGEESVVAPASAPDSEGRTGSVASAPGAVPSLPRRLVEELIEASSLGTPEAKALRDSVPDEQVERIMARVREINAADALIDRVLHGDDQP